MTICHNVAIVDDDSGIGSLFSRILSTGSFRATHFDNPQEFLSELDLATFHCVILDERMAPLNGMETFRAMRERGHNIPAMLVSGYATVELSMQAIREGIAFVLEKPVRADTLLAEVEKLCASHDLEAGKTIKRAYEQSLLDLLSDREVEVLRLVAEGQMNKQIASTLGVGVRTIETYRNRIMGKIDAHTAADLVAFAISVGLREAGLKKQS